jgi:hypothetical protein
MRVSTTETAAEAMELLRDQIERCIGLDVIPQHEVESYVRAVTWPVAQARADVYRTMQREAIDPVWRERYGIIADRMQTAINKQRFIRTAA